MAYKFKGNELEKDGRPLPAAFVPGVPARDLTDEEYDQHVEAGRIDPKGPTGELYEKQSTSRRKAVNDADR